MLKDVLVLNQKQVFYMEKKSRPQHDRKKQGMRNGKFQNQILAYFEQII
jgi:hypothetical protein